MFKPPHIGYRNAFFVLHPPKKVGGKNAIFRKNEFVGKFVSIYLWTLNKDYLCAVRYDFEN